MSDLFEGYGSPYARILMDNQLDEVASNKPMIGTDVSSDGIQLPPIAATDIITMYNNRVEVMLGYEYGEAGDYLMSKGDKEGAAENDREYEREVKDNSLKSFKALGIKNGIIRCSGTTNAGKSVTFNLKFRSLQWVSAGIKLNLEID